jgi:hypothetical protein
VGLLRAGVPVVTIRTVGDLRAALAGLPDDLAVNAQIWHGQANLVTYFGQVYPDQVRLQSRDPSIAWPLCFFFDVRPADRPKSAETPAPNRSR